MFRSIKERRCITNLGGFCNITWIPGGSGVQPGEDQLTGWITHLYGKDVCACNQLLDRISRDLTDSPFDEGGALAAAGSVIPTLFDELHKLLLDQAKQERSLGTGDELAFWVARYKSNFPPNDLARTVCASIAATIASPGPVDRRILAGGGVNNKTLVAEIIKRSKCPVSLSDVFGVPVSYREAVAVAILGALCQDRVPITLAQVTGAIPPPVSGSWVLP